MFLSFSFSFFFFSPLVSFHTTGQRLCCDGPFTSTHVDVISGCYVNSSYVRSRCNAVSQNGFSPFFFFLCQLIDWLEEKKTKNKFSLTKKMLGRKNKFWKCNFSGVMRQEKVMKALRLSTFYFQAWKQHIRQMGISLRTPVGKT